MNFDFCKNTNNDLLEQLKCNNIHNSLFAEKLLKDRGCFMIGSDKVVHIGKLHLQFPHI